MNDDSWIGRTPTNKGEKVPQIVKAPEWAYCTAPRFVELLTMAEARKTTLEQMQGGWNYPAEEMRDE